MTLNTAQQRRHAALLRKRDTSATASAVADEIEARAELEDALAGQPAQVADSARMVEDYPILGLISREGGVILSIEHPYCDVDVEWARQHGVDVAFQWCHDAMAGLRQCELIRIWIGTQKSGCRLQWDRHRRRWFEQTNARNFGNNWACGGNWSGRDKVGAETLDEILWQFPEEEAAQIRAALPDRK